MTGKPASKTLVIGLSEEDYAIAEHAVADQDWRAPILRQAAHLADQHGCMNFCLTLAKSHDQQPEVATNQPDGEGIAIDDAGHRVWLSWQ